ncbi:MAG: CapA family protein [Synergistaceae bacterium]|jgi:poly-gamma-glutamate synthesis protein (capsule biosynthesis protein)|nr:CapA family protein [Synergistaceae bacterium]
MGNQIVKTGSVALVVLSIIAAISAVVTGVVIVVCVNVNIRLSADGIRFAQPPRPVRGAETVPAVQTLFTEASGQAQGGGVSAASPPDGRSEREKPPKTDIGRTPELTQVILSLAGDCTLGQSYGSASPRHFSAFYESKPKEYFFEGVSGVFASDDITIVNLEGPLTRSTVIRGKPEDGPKYWFKGAPEYAEILSAGSVEIANLANNHTRDFGDEGYRDTKAALAGAGVGYFGNDDVLTRQIRGIKIGFFGLSASAGAGVIKERISALRRAGAQVIIASFHGGLPVATYIPTPAQKRAAYAAIDNGAAFVVEHHPHVLQGIEHYNGGVIAYSLGNFCFGGNTNPSDKDTMIFQIVITKMADKLYGTYRVIPASISSHDDYNDYRPRLLVGEEAKNVLDKVARLSIGTDAASPRGLSVMLP